ncbi:sporulation protein SsgA [Altererythrobacter endophyticus]|uniref:Sporulation protein SsgA n=1 Tax=Altericroceibacterium endophyticum TaxID=1808508 RepID=A0A6I4T0T4_9SPHN|nr:sporulation protein SsgA [Altericroceibacterium endophyticum]
MRNKETVAVGGMKPILQLLPVVLLAGCAAASSNAPQIAPIPRTGPAADYPMVVGDPYSVQGMLYTPQDVMNYDEVGYVALDPAGGATISAEHHTLPLPSYVEVTSLDTGRTILVRVERRGPMQSKDLIGLSPGAMEQLGSEIGGPVRVRRVNPPEESRALLRRGGQAGKRMDTPMSLVEVLRRRLPESGSVPLNEESEKAAPLPIRDETGSKPEKDDSAAVIRNVDPDLPSAAEPPENDSSGDFVSRPIVQAVQPVRAAASQSAAPATAPIENGFIVQAGAYSRKAGAEQVASDIDGFISPSGSLYRVRTGPFKTRAEAQSALAKVKAAGYSDARIYRQN